MNTEHFIQSIKAAGIGTLLSLVFALIFALIVRFCPIGATPQLVIAQSLKALSLVLGCLLIFRGEDGWKKGLLAGAVFTLLTYISFSGISGFAFSWKILLDLFLGVSVGVFSGIAAVNLKRSL